MHFKDNITLSFEGSEWLASYGNRRFESDTLEELDKEVEAYLRKVLFLSSGDIVTMIYLFDNNSIPEWIRQYSNHYFNRKVEFKF